MNPPLKSIPFRLRRAWPKLLTAPVVFGTWMGCTFDTLHLHFPDGDDASIRVRDHLPAHVDEILFGHVQLRRVHSEEDPLARLYRSTHGSTPHRSQRRWSQR